MQSHWLCILAPGMEKEEVADTMPGPRRAAPFAVALALLAILAWQPSCGGSDGGGGAKEPPFQTLIVLGWPANPDGSPSPEETRRVDLAMRLYRAGEARKAIFTGGAVQNEWVEGQVMADYAVDQGMDPADALVEGEARHTDENIRNSSAIMAANGWWQAAIVSTPGHLYFVALCDANCVVRLGRAEMLASRPDDGDVIQVLDYTLYPHAVEVEPSECLDLVLGLQCIGAFQPPGAAHVALLPRRAYEEGRIRTFGLDSRSSNSL